MNANVRRIFVEKKAGFDVEAQGLYQDLRRNLGIDGLTKVRIVHRYDIEGITEEQYQSARTTVFAELPVDQVADETWVVETGRVLVAELLPGQYDQRADSAAQCIQLLTQLERPTVRVAKLMIFEGAISDSDFQRIEGYCINPLEAHRAAVVKPATLTVQVPVPEDVPIVEGFTGFDSAALERLRLELGLAMSGEDLAFCQAYFRDSEKRNPSLTEIRVLDTYWSDHCRHTTFLTRIENVEFEEGPYVGVLRRAYEAYLQSRDYVYGGAVKEIPLLNFRPAGLQ